MNGERKVHRSAEMYVMTVIPIKVRERLNASGVPELLPPMHTFPLQIQYHINLVSARKVVPNSKERSSKPLEQNMAGETKYI